MTNEKHWTDDEDLLEDYVLDRIEDPVRSALDAHLNSCSQCRTRMEIEAGLAAGIREFAARKTRVQLQTLTTGRRRTVPLPHILSMAAAIVLIVGIGFYNRWFMNPIPQPGHVEFSQKQQEVSSTDKDAALTRDDAKTMKKRDKVDATGEFASKDEPRSNTQPTTAPSDFLAQEEGHTTTPGTSQYELTGFLLRKEADDRGKEAVGGAAQKSAENEGVPAYQMDAIENREAGKTGNLVILRGKEKDDSVAQPNGQVRCTLERVDSLFYLTIFVSQGNYFGDSRSVRATLAAPDSLVLVLDGAQLGLKLPVEFKGQIVPGE